MGAGLTTVARCAWIAAISPGLLGNCPGRADAPKVQCSATNVHLYSPTARYDVRLMDPGGDKGNRLEIIERENAGEKVVSSLGEQQPVAALRFAVERDRSSGVVFIGILWKLRFGYFEVLRIERTSLRLTQVLDGMAGAFHLSRGRVREISMAKYVFGMDALPKGVRGGDAYWRWRTYSPHAGRFVAGPWHRAR